MMMGREELIRSLDAMHKELSGEVSVDGETREKLARAPPPQPAPQPQSSPQHGSSLQPHSGSQHESLATCMTLES
jgi:hypothetical protein